MAKDLEPVYYVSRETVLTFATRPIHTDEEADIQAMARELLQNLETQDAVDELRDLERSFAFERASGVIESECVTPPLPDLSHFDSDWWDLDSAEMDLSQEVEYLDSRRLLRRHPANAQWVQICNEDEPLPDPALETQIPSGNDKREDKSEQEGGKG